MVLSKYIDMSVIKVYSLQYTLFGYISVSCPELSTIMTQMELNLSTSILTRQGFTHIDSANKKKVIKYL